MTDKLIKIGGKMGKYLDLDDVASGHHKAEKELEQAKKVLKKFYKALSKYFYKNCNKRKEYFLTFKIW